MLVVTKWERRDGTERANLATAAFAWCQAMKRSEQPARSAKFYWTDADSVVVVADVDEERGDAEIAKTLFSLSDLARRTSYERWMDPKSGEEAYKTAGRI